MVRLALRRNLLASTIIAGSLMAAPAFAQTAVPAEATTAADDTIVVTGTLISNPNLERSSPVNVTTSEELELRQTNVAEQILREVPGIVPSIGSSVNNGNGGASFVDLRGLGSNRNIVLLDGRRITPAGLGGQVDLNNIPVALVDRVDVLTGGASTTYGADAITGVVNFVTRKDFAGAELQVSEQITGKGDGNVFRTDVTVGANFDDGKGNAVLSIGYQEADPVYQGARDFSNTNYDSYNPIIQLAGSGTTVPATFTAAGGSGRRQLDPVSGLTGPSASTVPFNFNPFNIFQTPFRRFNIFAQARYQLSDAVEVYTRALFSKNTVQTIVAPSGVFSSDVSIPLSNPFLPAGLRGQFCTSAGISAADCAAAATAQPTLANGAINPAYRTITTNLRRRFVEAGPRISDFQTTVFDYRVGVRGDITGNIAYDVNASYGESERPQTLQGYVLTSRVRQALLATNTTTCLNNTNGCVPLNVFGAANSITPAQVAFVTAESTSTVRTTLAQAQAVLTGDLGFGFIDDEAISFALGGEYRKYTARQRSDLLAQTPGELGGSGGAAPNITGGYEVSEAFVEVIAPILQDVPFFQSLTFEAGARYSKYTLDAPGQRGFDTFTYKAGGSWEPIETLKIRGNYSRNVRAPNITELFSPPSTGLTNLATDPCAGSAAAANATLRAVCIAQGAPAGSIGNIPIPSAGQVNTTGGGNIALSPEKADVWTIGAVIKPTFITGFSASVDYYNIIINGAVSAPTPSDAINACFAGGNLSPTNPNCLAIRRDPSTGALDGDSATTPGLPQSLSNLGRLKTSGIDGTLNYRRELGFARLNISATANYTLDNRFKATPTSFDRECTGYYSINCSFTGSLNPKFSSTVRTTFGFEGVDLSVLWRHISPFNFEGTARDFMTAANGTDGRGFDADTRYLFPGTPTGTGALGFGDLQGRNVNFNRIPSYDFFDLASRISITDDIALTITLQNIFNRKPPLVGSTAGSTSFNSGNTYPSTYDALGTRFGAQIRLKF